jgi:ABC-type uncharacterized transport system auxiliary subunit
VSAAATRLTRVLAMLALAATLGACAFAPPKPWEKGELAKPSMQVDPASDRLEAKYQEHVYFSKEAAGGGYGVGGGGCGCN